MTFRQYRRAVGQRIQKARWLAGWTQAKAAESAGIDARNYSELERGRTNPTLETLFEIARALKRPAWEFLKVDPVAREHVDLDAVHANPPPTGRPRKKAKPRRSR